MIKKAATAAVTLLLAVACAMPSFHRRQEKFDQISGAYEHALRWSKFETAAKICQNESNDGDAVSADRLRNFRVTSYEVKKTVLADEKRSVLRTVEIHYYRTDRMIEKMIRIQETWSYDEAAHYWYLTSGLPELQ